MTVVRNMLLASAAAILLIGTVALAQTNPASTSETKSTANGGVLTSDRQFMDKAAQGGMAEVQMGQLAQQNAQSQQ